VASPPPQGRLLDLIAGARVFDLGLPDTFVLSHLNVVGDPAHPLAITVEG
jgi:hypothetical protein